MKQFKLLDSPEQASYFKEIDWDNAEDYEDPSEEAFDINIRQKFLQQVRNNSNIKKQAGYSKTRMCDFISLILVQHLTGDGPFIGHSIKSTYITKKGDKTADAYNLLNEGGEFGWDYMAAYHVLPDGKLMEFKMTQSYEKEVESIYELISKTRVYYDLDNKLPPKDTDSKRLKL